MTDRPVELRRALGTLAVTVYAVGDILGAGIYALVGKVVAVSGTAAWLSFAVAASIAGVTGLTYAEMGSRVPLAAGAAAYCRRAFRAPAVGGIVGLLVLASGIASAATVSRAFTGYLDAWIELPPLPTAIAVLVLMSIVNYRGIEESARVNLVLTMVEFSGLLLVIGAGLYFLLGGGAAASEPSAALAAPPVPPVSVDGVIGGASLAFFAYVGFEDTVNVAEEMKDPRRSLPRAIVIAILVTSAVYAGVTLVALAVVPAPQLAASDAPLLEVLEMAGVGITGAGFSLIAMLAIGNTGLLNLIMASRMAYGMAREGLLPAFLGRVHPGRQTPWVAIVAVLVAAGGLAATGGVEVLAQTTSFLLLAVFLTVHVALDRLKRRDRAPEGLFVVPRFVPWVGVLVCGGMLVQYPLDVVVRGVTALLVAFALYVLVGRGAARREGSGGERRSSPGSPGR